MTLGLVNAYREAAKGKLLETNPVLLDDLRQRLMERGHALMPQSSQPQGPGRIAIAQ